MAYISQEDKKALAPKIKSILKQYGLKGSLSIRHHSTLVLNIAKGGIDFIAEANKKNKEIADRRGTPMYECEGYIQVNTHYPETYGKGSKVLSELVDAMKGPNWFDESDIMTDYFHVAHYVDINIGKWNKPYVCEA